MVTNRVKRIRDLIRNIPDYPKPGIIFRDITSLLNNKQGFNLVSDEIQTVFLHESIELFNKVVTIEARGFIFGSLLAEYSYTPLVLARKNNKLPGPVIGKSYQKEYGEDSLYLQVSDIERGDKVIIVDDLIALGSTALAVVDLVHQLGGKVTACYFMIELDALGGRKKLEEKGIKVISSVHY